MFVLCRMKINPSFRNHGFGQGNHHHSWQVEPNYLNMMRRVNKAKRLLEYPIDLWDKNQNV